MASDGRPPGAAQAARAGRAVAVVCLLAIAAVALQGRRGLEWDRLTGVPNVDRANLLLAGIGITILVVAIRRLLRLWRQLKPPAPEDRPQVDALPQHRAVVVLAVVVLVCSVAACYFVLRFLLSGDPEGGAVDPDPTERAGALVPSDGVLPLLVGLLVALGIAGLVTRWLRRPADSGAAVEEVDSGDDASALADAVTAAEQAMERHDDTRAAIIAAYREMATALSAEAGRRPSDTPTELLDRAVSAGLVSRAAGLELTELFREARFSRHALPPGARGAAEAALARVSAELGAVRA